jgi:predicted alpha/beta hydrolase
VGLYIPTLIKISQISRIFGRVMTKLFRKGMKDRNFHCIGHSFGAHSCGIMGREVITASKSQFKIGR